MKIALCVHLLILFSLCGCLKEETSAQIGVDFVWDLKHHRQSPEIHLSNVPMGTHRLDVLFFDATAEWEHGAGSLLYDGSNIIPAGAIKEFKGLTNLWGFPKFKVIVEAFNHKGELVGKGSVTKSPPNPSPAPYRIQ